MNGCDGKNDGDMGIFGFYFLKLFLFFKIIFKNIKNIILVFFENRYYFLI